MLLKVIVASFFFLFKFYAPSDPLYDGNGTVVRHARDNSKNP
jgi:hypothetical protein